MHGLKLTVWESGGSTLGESALLVCGQHLVAPQTWVGERKLLLMFAAYQIDEGEETPQQICQGCKPYYH